MDVRVDFEDYGEVVRYVLYDGERAVIGVKMWLGYNEGTLAHLPVPDLVDTLMRAQLAEHARTLGVIKEETE